MRLLMLCSRNLVVRAKIGEAAIWVVLDTGAARSFVQTQVSKDMAEDERCRKAAGKRLAIDHPLRVEGGEKGRKVGRNSNVRRFDLTFAGREAGGQPQDLLHCASGGLRIGHAFRKDYHRNA